MAIRQSIWSAQTAYAAVLSLAALYCTFIAHSRWAVVSSVLNARPGLSHVDLSRPGTTAAPLPRNEGGHHYGQSVYLEIPGPSVPTPNGFKDLSGSVQLVGHAGGVLESLTLGNGQTGDSSGQGRYYLGNVNLKSGDEYRLVVEVNAGDPSLAGRDAIVYSQYAVCELEMIPVMGRWLLAGMFGVPAAIAWLVVAVRFLWPAACHKRVCTSEAVKVSPTDEQGRSPPS